MTEHTALYRKYRPHTFAEVKDQEHIVKVLEGAIKKDTIPHALLFTGGRGTGKTTLARIFAKEIGTSEIDLYEIDAASNRGIDDIRELKEAVHTVPYESKFKVYIIDEVHMLTKEAFNALLKTLEEPPEHVVFILATTEIEKLLDTIISRCQVFTMHAPSRAVLVDMVIEIAKKEGFKLDKAAADLIAIAADGSFRDALGITQKVILSSGDAIGDSNEVAEIIGAPKTEILTTLVKALNEGDTTNALCAIAEAKAANVEIKLLARLLLERIRAILIMRNAKDLTPQVAQNFNEEDGKQLATLAADPNTTINSHTLLKLLEATELAARISTPAIALEYFVLVVTENKK